MGGNRNAAITKLRLRDVTSEYNLHLSEVALCIT